MTRGRIVAVSLAVVALVAAVVVVSGRSWIVQLRPNLEDRLPDGSPYNPSTQSLLRGHHWLDRITEARVSVSRDGRGSIALADPDRALHLTIRNLPLDQLVPRLHYVPPGDPDGFDAFNLLLAEYSRNSLSVPVGSPGDSMAHFETELDEVVPWTLEGDYAFKPNPFARPVRIAVINNCLAPGMWELAARDRSGEVYHSWFEMPLDAYYDLVARTNDVDAAFVERALEWSTDPVPLDLERLRSVEGTIGRVSCTVLVDAKIGYSSQDSRRKLSRRFVETQADGRWVSPQRIGDLTSNVCRFSDFVEPGVYSMTKRRPFDFRFLRTARFALVSRVKPLTRYDWRTPVRGGRATQEACLELEIHFDDHTITIGNLPVSLLVPQEDLVIAGFGVGILSSEGLAERRAYLIEDGPPPSFAYLARSEGGVLVGLNSHDFGIEQLFIRTHIQDDPPWWEITITSYERIVDIARIRVEIPEPLHAELLESRLQYMSPVYRTYRDDNIR